MRTVGLILALVTVVALCGCGGGGGTSPTPNQMGALSGQLVGAANPAAYQITLDGSPVNVTPGADGRFTIPNVPPGDHALGFVGGSGMEGAYVGAIVRPGETTDIGDVQPVLGGQIAGLVMHRDENGVLTPLAGVEVIADPNPPVYATAQQNGSDPSDPTDPPVIMPPPQPGDGLPVRAITDSNGSYLIPAVPEGAYVVTVNVPGLNQGVQWIWVSPGTTAVADFQLEDAIDPGVATIQGTITGVADPGVPPADPNQTPGNPYPLEGALVTVYADQAWQPPYDGRPVPLPEPALRGAAMILQQATGFIPPPYWFREFSTLTDAQGRYSLNVPTGYLNLTVWADGYDAAYERFALRPGQTVDKSYTLHVFPPAPEPEPEPPSTGPSR